ncbi:MAG TPA: GAF domain-containing protein [Dehalococcoidia bacterium]|nr:GAF domain-containing protein [Dehalococcoidia bacterium]
MGVEVNLQDIIDGLEDELLVIDGQYCVLFVNSAARRALPEGIGSPVGRRCYQLFKGRDRPCSAPLWDCPLRKVVNTGRAVVVTHHEHMRDAEPGRDRYVSVIASPLRDSNGKVTAIVELRRDITAQRQLESQIMRRYHELSALDRISTAVSGSLDLDTVLNVALDNVLELVDGTIGGILLLDEGTQTLSYRVHRGLSDRYVAEMRLRLGEGIAGRVAQSGEPMLTEDISADQRAARPDLISTEGLKAFVSVPLRAKDKVLGVMNVASYLRRRFGEDDMHLLDSIGHQLGMAIEGAKLYQELRKASETYRQLLQQSILAQEEERKRIARELHDETGQTLTGLALNLQVIMEMMELPGVEAAEVKTRLKKVQAFTAQAVTEIGKLINDLRPSLLDELGLVAAVRKYAEVQLEPHGVNVTVESDLTPQRLPSEVEVALFRIAQGAISNVMKYAEARNVTISLAGKNDEVIFTIEDDGRGFDTAQLAARREAMGVLTMQERVNLLGGTCTIQSRPGHGTMVTVKVPITWSRADAEDTGTGGR